MATGGAQTVLLDQASWFHAKGYQVNAAFLYDKDGLHIQWRQAYPFPIHDLKAFQSSSGILRQLSFLLRGVWRLWNLLRQNKFDVVETFTLDSNLFVLPWAWLAGVPVRVATNHGFARNDSWLKRISHTFMINSGLADILIAVTQDIREQSIREGARPARVMTIANGIQLPPLQAKNTLDLFETFHLAEGTTFLLSVGRLVHEKAYEVLIQSMKIVVAKYPAIFLGIAGDGILRDRLQALIDRLDLSENVCLLGDRKDVPDLMANADVFVMSSRSEGMPVALLEAMGSGLPVVATRVGGLPEVIADPSHGILVPPESPADLAAAILQLVRSPELCASLGKAGRQRIRDIYTIENMCSQYESVMKNYYQRKRSQ